MGQCNASETSIEGCVYDSLVFDLVFSRTADEDCVMLDESTSFLLGRDGCGEGCDERLDVGA